MADTVATPSPRKHQGDSTNPSFVLLFILLHSDSDGSCWCISRGQLSLPPEVRLAKEQQLKELEETQASRTRLGKKEKREKKNLKRYRQGRFYGED